MGTRSCWVLVDLPSLSTPRRYLGDGLVYQKGVGVQRLKVHVGKAKGDKAKAEQEKAEKQQ